MLHIISGAPGVGKSALNAYFLQSVYFAEGRTLLRRTIQKIEELNKTRLHPLTPPEQPPIFSDFKVKFLVGYKKWFEPYYLNGYYLGLGNERLKTQYLPPNSKVFLGEAQRYYNSRKSANFPDFVSRFYEMHRHHGLELYLDVQRVRLIDTNIRELCTHFIEVQKMQHKRDELGRIIQSEWYCREFGDWVSFEAYLNTGAATYKETNYTYKGNIFDLYDSFSFAANYLPEDKAGNDFSYLKHLTKAEAQTVSEDIAEFYMSGEPVGYRKAVSEDKENKGKKNERANRPTA